jgi:hypothetical protein
MSAILANAKYATNELVAVLPDSLIYVSGIMALLTTSFPNFMFFISMLEALLGFHLLRGGIAMFDLPFLRPLTAQCQSGFKSPTLGDISFFGSHSQSAFPSSPLFMISAAAAYLFQSLDAQSKELEILGPAYSSRYYISLLSLLGMIFILGCWRLYSGCETPSVVILSILLGLAVGSLILYQNYKIFGPDSVNMLAIPLLKSKTVKGEKIYACTGKA